MKKFYLQVGILFIFIFMVFILFAGILPCSAWVLPADPYFAPYQLPFPQIYDPRSLLCNTNPFLPYVIPRPALTNPIIGPTLSPYVAGIPTLGRSAAATIVVLPQPAPAVTAYAPLGTLTLTPSTLVFLILLFTLPE